jgi:hypothetical protein
LSSYAQFYSSADAGQKRASKTHIPRKQSALSGIFRGEILKLQLNGDIKLELKLEGYLYKASEYGES